MYPELFPYKVCTQNTFLILYVKVKLVEMENTTNEEMERNPAYISIEISQIEDKPTYVNLS